MGLSVWDLALLGYILVAIHPWLSRLALDWLAFLTVALMAYVLMGLRLRFRRHIIRDFVLYHLKIRGIM